ncbi:unnamed protein product [Adineta ricciae]|nr:unnamed protein product [Adineta ricciae]
MIENTSMCIMTNAIYAKYRSYFTYLDIYTLIPVIVISIFGSLTYYHTTRFGTGRTLSAFTRQMVKMGLFQTIAVILFNVPYTGEQIYFLTTTNLVKDAYRRAQEQLVTSFFAVYGYGPYMASLIFV